MKSRPTAFTAGPAAQRRADAHGQVRRRPRASGRARRRTRVRTRGRHAARQARRRAPPDHQRPRHDRRRSRAGRDRRLAARAVRVVPATHRAGRQLHRRDRAAARRAVEPAVSASTRIRDVAPDRQLLPRDTRQPAAVRRPCALAMSASRSDAKSGDVLRAGMAGYFPELANVRLDYCWGGLVDITADRLPRASTTASITRWATAATACRCRCTWAA